MTEMPPRLDGVAETVSPWAMTMLQQIANPRPAPPDDRRVRERVFMICSSLSYLFSRKRKCAESMDALRGTEELDRISFGLVDALRRGVVCSSHDTVVGPCLSWRSELNYWELSDTCMMEYPAALPHDSPVEIADGVFVVYGCVMINAIVRFTRNMVIVRDGDELTLINPVRVGDVALGEIEALGTIRHVLRLGPMHGMDDPFYVDRYKAQFWSFEGGTYYTQPLIARPLSEGGELPFSDAELLQYGHI